MKISTGAAASAIRLAEALFKQRIQLNAVKMEVDESRVRARHKRKARRSLWAIIYDVPSAPLPPTCRINRGLI